MGNGKVIFGISAVVLLLIIGIVLVIAIPALNGNSGSSGGSGSSGDGQQYKYECQIDVRRGLAIEGLHRETRFDDISCERIKECSGGGGFWPFSAVFGQEGTVEMWDTDNDVFIDDEDYKTGTFSGVDHIQIDACTSTSNVQFRIYNDDGEREATQNVRLPGT